MNSRLPLAALLLAGLLVGCNDSDSTSPEPLVQQKMGYGESELYDPINNPVGALLPAGATAVLFLEAPGATPNEGDTGGVGYDELWFEWPAPTVLAMFMEDQDLGVIARVELWDTNGGLHLGVDAERRYGEVELSAGIYGLRLYAAHDEPAPMSAFIRHELDEPSASNQHVSIQANASDLEMAMQYRECPQCDLAYANLVGADLSYASLAYANLTGADLSRADLLRARLKEAHLTGARLREANLMEANLEGAYLNGANLNGANLYGTHLSGANLTGATLILANLTNANLSGTNLTGAKLDGARWVNGRICALGSIGRCER
ncbi:MAG: pentapeptide repeat-containing protein [Chromatiales bacterium]|nr:pentapeptide repeat-containing protein [Chromatiales bacterium]